MRVVAFCYRYFAASAERAFEGCLSSPLVNGQVLNGHVLDHMYAGVSHCLIRLLKNRSQGRRNDIHQSSLNRCFYKGLLIEMQISICSTTEQGHDDTVYNYNSGTSPN